MPAGTKVAAIRKAKRKAEQQRRSTAEAARQAAFLASLSAADIAWAAGFWEGEGSIGARHANASQVERWPLERLQQLFGGNIRMREADRPNRRPCHQWFICGEQARAFIAAIYLRLSPRRQAQIDAKFVKIEHRQRQHASLHLNQVSHATH